MSIQEMGHKEAAAELARRVEALGFTVECVFVPFSHSRNAKSGWQSLNWKCLIKHNGAPILDCDYGQGEGHAPAYSFKEWATQGIRKQAIKLECETGRRAIQSPTYGAPRASHKALKPPSVAEIMESLARDSSVLDYSKFEQWAADYGVDPDSRQGEADYRLSIGHALALRNAIGDAELEALREIAFMM